MKNALYEKLQRYLSGKGVEWSRLVNSINECDYSYSPLEYVDYKLFQLICSFCQENEIDYIDFIQYLTIKTTGREA